MFWNMTRTQNFAAWLRAFAPSPTHTRPTEWIRAALGAGAALLLSSWLCSVIFDAQTAQHLIGPIGASAVLLFAVSSGQLAQPWSIIVSYLVATSVALGVTHFFGYTLLSASLALSLTLILMCLLRCLHPPGGALTLCVVFANPELSTMGIAGMLPVLISASCLLVCALLYNNLTRVRYPRQLAPAQPNDHQTRDPAPQSRVGITSKDLDQALDELGEFVDVTREDLETIIRSTEKHALRRSMGDIRASQVMSRDVIWANPQTSAQEGLRMLLLHHLKALPILDEKYHLVGIVSLVDLVTPSLRMAKKRRWIGLRKRDEVVLSDIMSSPVSCVNSDAHAVELIPLLSDRGLHCLPVIEHGKMVGVITQSDLIAALHRDLLSHLG